jgi:hypothetical protein
VTGTLERLAAFVVAPEPPRRAVTLPGCCRAAVLGGRADVPPLAAALALTLRAADRRPAAVVALWGAELPPRAPAARAAAKLAHLGSAAGWPGATARGRLAWLALPPEPAAAIETLLAAAGAVDAPLVTALAGARPALLDDLVAGHDLVVVAAEPGSVLARTALQRLASRGVRATACRPLGRRAPRALAMAGLAATPRLELASGHGDQP